MEIRRYVLYRLAHIKYRTFLIFYDRLYVVPLTGIARIMEVESGLHGRQQVKSQHRDRESACASL